MLLPDDATVAIVQKPQNGGAGLTVLVPFAMHVGCVSPICSIRPHVLNYSNNC